MTNVHGSFQRLEAICGAYEPFPCNPEDKPFLRWAVVDCLKSFGKKRAPLAYERWMHQPA